MTPPSLLTFPAPASLASLMRTGALAAGLVGSCIMLPHLTLAAVMIVVGVVYVLIRFRRPSVDVTCETPVSVALDDMDATFLRRHLRIYRILTPRHPMETTQQ